MTKYKARKLLKKLGCTYKLGNDKDMILLCTQEKGKVSPYGKYGLYVFLHENTLRVEYLSNGGQIEKILPVMKSYSNRDNMMLNLQNPETLEALKEEFYRYVKNYQE